MAMLPSSSSSSITYAFSYDVFLSFTGCDTRQGFTGNLYKALDDKGIHTFIDDKELHKGDEITPALEEAIEKSRIAIVVLSKNYAFSSFCLHELLKILEYFKKNCRLVWPIFYDVDPSDVRKQTGTYGEAMTLHMNRFKDNKEKLRKWRTTLEQVADLSGWHFKHGDGSYEHEFIGKIVSEVSRNINRVALPIADYPVGLDSQVREVISLLDVGSDDKVHIIGIHGIGGIGKTTLALAVYNLVADQFEGLCFLENVRESSNKHGLLHVQKTLLFAVLGEKEIEITSVKQGISIIKHRLQQKKVLLILDDVAEEEHLKQVVGSPSWFGLGSRVIITTRNKHLLECYKVERTHEVEELNKKASFQLLRWKAFKNEEVRPGYADLLNRAVAYASGLPLALEVIGSNLCGKSVQQWKSALEHYERILDKKIQKILEVSFYALEEKEQCVFLDIACCLKGYKFDEVISILNAHHGQCIIYQIGVLVDKSLIKINWYDQVTLHDLMERMGKEIVRQESPGEPGGCSRLWSKKDIFEVLEENTGTNKIEMIHLDYASIEVVDWEGEAFKEMKKLKTLIIRKNNFSKGPKYLPNSLRVLEWWKYPLQHLPSDFHPNKLSICKLPGSSFMSLEFLCLSKKLVTMKVLNLNNCRYLTQIPNLSNLPNLEELSFEFCGNLITIDHLDWSLDKLKILSATACSQLRSFPPLKLPSLEKLKLSSCSSLESFPEILENMEKITELDLDKTNMTRFPSSFRNLAGLKKLEVTQLLPSRSLVLMPQLVKLSILKSSGRILEIEGDENMSSMFQSSNVEHIKFSCCHLSYEFLASVLPLFANLKELDLRQSEFTIVPKCIEQCRILRTLLLNDCKQLREIEGIPPSLKILSAIGCESLSLSCRSMLLKKELHEVGGTDFELPSLPYEELYGFNPIPMWFKHGDAGYMVLIPFFNHFIFCICFPYGKEYGEVKIMLNNEVITEVYVTGGHIRLVSVMINSKDEENHLEVQCLSKEKKLEVQSISSLNYDFVCGIHPLT
ncbi:disease resistance protein RPV1-like isoform X2 [Lotus japonicus]|uniref:disease resistance protein RPV1-like isoform X2 n=1 Tax=Lotus japonicus TaxID=34305 RepID=UPI0025912A8A|nr:disease resistance protein RPV1-like isoform X2 [Lotus japonicus]